MVAIKGMKMPSGCLLCQFEHGFNCVTVRSKPRNVRQYVRDGGRPDDCPLVELTDGLYQVQDGKIWKYQGKGKKHGKTD